MSPPEPNIIVVPTPQALAAQAATEFQTRSRAAIAERGCFSVALSGANTPKQTFELLATPEFAETIDWKNVHVFWGDERCVPPDHPESNYGMAQAALLSKVSLPLANIHRMHGESDPHQAASEYEQELHRFFSGPSAFDLNYMGLGLNGHTASLFPHTQALEVRDRLCVATLVPKNVPSPWRLTLTYPALNASRSIFFLVEGSDKAEIAAEVLEGPRDIARRPAQGIDPSGSLNWLLDAKAAAKLTKASLRQTNENAAAGN